MAALAKKYDNPEMVDRIEAMIVKCEAVKQEMRMVWDSFLRVVVS